MTPPIIPKFSNYIVLEGRFATFYSESALVMPIYYLAPLSSAISVGLFFIHKIAGS